jgi:hypothetical protein
VVGTHSTSTSNTSLWALVDLDAHDGGNILAVTNERAAKAWYRKLVLFGFRPLLTTSDERGGFHLRVLFDRAVPTGRAYAFARWLVADHPDHGVDEPEVFPKQANVEPDGFGNWARVPGLHHSRPVWAKVWDGTIWLAGEDAVRFVLGLTGDLPDLIPPNVIVPPPRRPAGLVVTNLPDEQPRPAAIAGERMTDVEVALACLAAIDNSGQGRHYDQWLGVGSLRQVLSHAGGRQPRDDARRLGLPDR